MNIESLKTFLTICKSQSYSRAAKQLCISPSAVSKRINKLEEELGMILFDQTGHYAKLTEAGKRLLPFASKIVINSNDAIKSINEINDQIFGTIILGVTYFVGFYRLPNIVKGFLLKYPDVNFDIKYLPVIEMYHQIEQGNLDFAISTLVPPVPPIIDTKELWHENLQIVVSKSHELASLDNITIDILANYPAILPAPGYPIRDSVEALFIKANKRLLLKMDMNNLQVNKELADLGLGWSVLPTEMSSDNLKILDIPELKISHIYYLVHHQKKSFSLTEKKLLEFLK